VFYLITKAVYRDKPTYESLAGSLESMKVLCEVLGVNRIGIPRLGCGLDGLQWEQVREILLNVFAGTGMEIVVCTPPADFKGRRAPYRGDRGRGRGRSFRARRRF
jgi:hypothetical protein